jgi:hypothetical protein
MMTELDVSEVDGEIKIWERVRKLVGTNERLTLSDWARYQYQAASHASRPDAVPVLRDSHKVVK